MESATRHTNRMVLNHIEPSHIDQVSTKLFPKARQCKINNQIIIDQDYQNWAVVLITVTSHDYIQIMLCTKSLNQRTKI